MFLLYFSALCFSVRAPHCPPPPVPLATLNDQKQFGKKKSILKKLQLLNPGGISLLDTPPPLRQANPALKGGRKKSLRTHCCSSQESPLLPLGTRSLPLEPTRALSYCHNTNIVCFLKTTRKKVCVCACQKGIFLALSLSLVHQPK